MKRLRTARGVELYEQSDGATVWYITYQANKKRHWEPIGPPKKEKGRDVTLVAARRRLAQRREEIRQARREGRVWMSAKEQEEQEQQQREQERAEQVTLRAFEPRFRRDYRGRSGKGVRSDYHKQQGRQLVAFFGDSPLPEIDNLAVDRFARHLSGQGIKAGTIRKRLMALGTRLHQAHRWGLIDRLPEIVKPSEDSEPYRDLSPAEWRSLVEEIEAAEDARTWELPLARLALVTGSRRQEVLGLEWENVRDGYLYLWQGKTGQGKKVPIGKVAQAALDQRKPYRFASKYVFCGERRTKDGPKPSGRKLDGRFVGRIFKARLEAAEVKDTQDGKVAFHGLRSTAGTWLAKAGMSEPLIATLLGHKMTQTVTQRYIRFREVPRDVVDRLDGLILSAEVTDRVTDRGNGEDAGVSVSKC